VSSHIRTEFPRRVREIEHTWIPFSDGCRLASRIWLPEDAEEDPVPAVLEYPYRKNDGTVTTPRAWRDRVLHENAAALYGELTYDVVPGTL
jgi:predicted acyl esterase